MQFTQLKQKTRWGVKLKLWRRTPRSKIDASQQNKSCAFFAAQLFDKTTLFANSQHPAEQYHN